MLWSEALLDAQPSSSKASAENIPSSASLDTFLVPRPMSDSYSELTLPFGSSPALLEQYTNASGGIRTGKQVFISLCCKFP